MDKDSVFSKTGKGLLEIKNKSNRLSKDHLRVLTLVDGKTKFGDLLAQTRVPESEARKIITQLCDDGFIKELVASVNETAPRTIPGGSADEGDDLDFTRILGPTSPASEKPPERSAPSPQAQPAPVRAAPTETVAKRVDPPAPPQPAPKSAAPAPAPARTPPSEAAPQRVDPVLSREPVKSASPAPAPAAVRPAASETPVRRLDPTPPREASKSVTPAAPPVRATPAPAQTPIRRLDATPPQEVAKSPSPVPAPAADEGISLDFEAELTSLKQAEERREQASKPIQTSPYRPGAPPSVAKPPPGAAASAQDEPADGAGEGLSDAFERVRRQAEQQAREEAIRIQQEARERRMLRKPK